MKKGGKGKNIIVGSVPYGEDSGFPALGEFHQEERKVSVAQAVPVDDLVLTPEGASIRDICTYNESC